MEEEKIVKLKLKKGGIYTVKILKQTDEFVEGIDKYGCPIRADWDNIKSMIPFSGAVGVW